MKEMATVTCPNETGVIKIPPKRSILISKVKILTNFSKMRIYPVKALGVIDF